MKLKGRQRGAFTLAEVLIVVVVMGTLATMVIAQFWGVTIDAEQAAFATSARTFMRAVELYKMDHGGSYPNGAAPGVVPPGLEEYILPNQWAAATPIGGQWDSAANAWGYTFTLGVFFPPPVQPEEADYMLKFDQAFDDGDLSTGSFQKLSNTHYFFILAH